MPIRDLILLGLFVVSLPVCFVRPFYGVLLWAVVAFLNPQSFIWGAASFFPWAEAVAIPTIAGTLIFSRGWKNVTSLKVALLAALWVWFTITSYVSTSTPIFMHHAQDTWSQWRLVSKILLMTGITIAVVNSFARLRIFVYVMAGCLGLYALKSFPFIFLSSGEFRLYGPPNSMIADNNDFGLALNMTWPLFFFLAQSETERWIKWACGLLSLVTIASVLFTYSRGALVGLVAILALMFLQSKQRIILVPVIALGLIVAFLFAPEAWRQRMDPTRQDAIDDSAKGRLNAWAYSWNLASDYPIAGGGFNTFTPALFDRYAPNVSDFHGPHSIYFQTLAEHGFVGIFLYLTLLYSCFRSLRRLRRRARSQGASVILNYANMFRYSLIGFLTSGAFLGRAYFDYFFAIVACVIVLEKICEPEWVRSDVLELAPEVEEQMA